MTVMFHKFPAPANFSYPDFFFGAKEEQGYGLISNDGYLLFQPLKNGILRVVSTLGESGDHQPSMVGLSRERAELEVMSEALNADIQAGPLEVAVEKATGRFVMSYEGRLVLETLNAPFGFTGDRQIALFDRPKDNVVYGLGSKTGGLDKGNRQYTFWNTDVVADHPHSFGGDDFDPGYVSIPFMISRYKKDWFGVFLNNTSRTYLQTGLKRDASSQWNPGHGLREKDPSCFAFGTEYGEMDLYIIPGPTLQDVVRRYAQLTGSAPMPPRWALGYHQCRWGYESAAEIANVAEKLHEAKIPVAAMWMDIDYMDQFKVFTFNPKTFSKEAREKEFKALRDRGTKIVTIVDPGVKLEKGYPVYEAGLEVNGYCKTREGKNFVGNVWPGRTVFPDYTKEDTIAFWADYTREWLDQGIDGIWIDMNDPSTGRIDYTEMRFEDGIASHDDYHNQYADLMARATVEGFARHDADKRPFILTRSACSGTQNYAAVWTGDNVSNETHLRMSIPQSLNLSLSGVSFNGPDVGGFIGDCSEELLVTWTLAGALFPFFRNHSCTGTKNQEPYVFRKKALRTIRDAINTRAKLLPYVYTQFHCHERFGDPVMRPVSYEFSGKDFERLEDQYMIGPALMVAPFVDLSSKKREVILPKGDWYQMSTGKWIKGGTTITIKRENQLSLFVRDGSILPVIEGNYQIPQPDFTKVAFHVFLNNAKEARGMYYEDDGATKFYENGEYNLHWLSAKRIGKAAKLEIETLPNGFTNGLKETNVYFYGAAPENAKDTKTIWPFGNHAVKTVKVAHD